MESSFSFRPLAIDDVGMLAHVGRLMRARNAQVRISSHSLLVEARDTVQRDELKRCLLRIVRTLDTPDKLLSLVVLDHGAQTLEVHRVYA